MFCCIGGMGGGGGGVGGEAVRWLDQGHGVTHVPPVGPNFYTKTVALLTKVRVAYTRIRATYMKSRTIYIKKNEIQTSLWADRLYMFC